MVFRTPTSEFVSMATIPLCNINLDNGFSLSVVTFLLAGGRCALSASCGWPLRHYYSAGRLASRDINRGRVAWDAWDDACSKMLPSCVPSGQSDGCWSRLRTPLDRAPHPASGGEIVICLHSDGGGLVGWISPLVAL